MLYGFDYGNRMRGAGPETYRYDAYGRRVRSINGTGGILYSLYGQSGRLLWQRDQRTSQRRNYVYLQGSLLAEHRRPIGSTTETIVYQHTDALGTPVAITNSSKTVLQRSEYEPYGYLLNRAMEDGPGYTGHATDAATGLVYMQQRYYDPLCGCFVSTDPIGALSGPFNRYWYANNNPYRFTDPDGRASWEDVKNFVKGVVIQIADSALQDAHYSSVNQSVVEAYPGELSVAGQCECDYKSPFPRASTNEEQFGHDMAPAIEVAVAALVGKTMGVVGEARATGPAIRSDIRLSGGRSGAAVRNLTGPANSAVRGANGRAFVTNGKGQVVLDITKDRVKPVVPGQGFGEKMPPSAAELKILENLHKD